MIKFLKRWIPKITSLYTQMGLPSLVNIMYLISYPLNIVHTPLGYVRSAELTLHTFKQIVSDLSLVSGNVCGEAIITKIKNTMSDRHIVQKSFNTLLEDYRADILPSVVQDCMEQVVTGRTRPTVLVE